ncbi:hypothetical protein M2351_001393 [Azospirillum canadense]|nr:hypothetical protein [Azospirillum canadense]
MADDTTFTPTPRPARFRPDGQPYPTCPCGEFQATSPDWHGWRACPCDGATGEVTSVGTARWLLSDRRLVEERRKARTERQEAEVADRVRGRLASLRKRP